jgi:hypothetical protein
MRSAALLATATSVSSPLKHFDQLHVSATGATIEALHAMMSGLRECRGLLHRGTAPRTSTLV